MIFFNPVAITLFSALLSTVLSDNGRNCVIDISFIFSIVFYFRMIFFRYCFYFLISADPPIKYDIMSRLHPALLKPETLYSLLRHRMIEEIRRRQNDQFRKDPEERKMTRVTRTEAETKYYN